MVELVNQMLQCNMLSIKIHGWKFVLYGNGKQNKISWKKSNTSFSIFSTLMYKESLLNWCDEILIYAFATYKCDNRMPWNLKNNFW